MENWGRKILKEILRMLGMDGLKRMVRSRAIGVGTVFVQGIRYALLLHYTILIVCFVCALSFFSSAYLIAEQISLQKSVNLTLPLGFCSGLALFSFGLLVLSLREKTWLRAFRIEALVDMALGDRTLNPDLKRPSGFARNDLDAEAIAEIVEEVLDQRRQKRQQKRKQKRTAQKQAKTKKK